MVDSHLHVAMVEPVDRLILLGEPKMKRLQDKKVLTLHHSQMTQTLLQLPSLSLLLILSLNLMNRDIVGYFPS